MPMALPDDPMGIGEREDRLITTTIPDDGVVSTRKEVVTDRYDVWEL